MEDIYARFCLLRRRLFEQIHRSLEKDDMALNEEGALEVKFFYPNYYDFTYIEPADIPEKVEIRLDCYTLGDKRTYLWRGKNFEDVLNKFEKTLNEWENTSF